MAETADILASIPKLVTAEDAAALVTLEEHQEKKVRKAARKALHQLRSRGVTIPEKGRSWNPGDALQAMRGAVAPAAILDVESVAGATRIAYSKPDDEADGTLLIALLAPDDRVLDFAAYTQTDGQRARMIRDWERQYGGRTVPADWARQRVRWARDATIEAGHSVPTALDDMLPVLGSSPQARPGAFMGEALADQEPDDGEVLGLLVGAGAARWPLLFDGNALFERLGEMSTTDGEDEGDDDSEAGQKRRLDRLRKAAAGDEAVRSGLRGPMANALEDGAVGLWMRGENAQAKRLMTAVDALRTDDSPEDVDIVGSLLQLQIAAVVRQQGLQAGAGGDGHEHSHDHDHAHDHSHDHEH